MPGLSSCSHGLRDPQSHPIITSQGSAICMLNKATERRTSSESLSRAVPSAGGCLAFSTCALVARPPRACHTLGCARRTRAHSKAVHGGIALKPQRFLCSVQSFRKAMRSHRRSLRRWLPFELLMTSTPTHLTRSSPRLHQARLVFTALHPATSPCFLQYL